MRHRWLALIALAAFAPAPASADDPPASPKGQADEFRALKKQFEEESGAWLQKFQAKVVEAAKQGKETPKFDAVPYPGAKFAPRFLELARREPGGPATFDALTLAASIAKDPLDLYGDQPKLPEYGQALDLIRKDDVTRPEMGKFALSIAYQVFDPTAHAIVREVIDRHPGRTVRARTAERLERGLNGAIKALQREMDRMKADPNVSGRAGEEGR